MWGQWCSNAVYRSYGVGVWKIIRRGRAIFFGFVIYEMGGGLKIRFDMTFGVEIKAWKKLFFKGISYDGSGKNEIQPPKKIYSTSKN
jgi:hypothetical protein